MRMPHVTVRMALAAAIVVLATPVVAQPASSDQGHSSHHPDSPAAQAAPGPSPAERAPRGGGGPGQRMMPGMAQGQGMMPGMAQGQGMMPGMGQGQGMPMGGGDMGQMMQMMQRMMAARAGAGMMRHLGRIDAHLAYARAALHITDAQAPQWNAFAEAARAAAHGMRQALAPAMQAAGQPLSAPEQLERHANLLSAQLDATRAMARAAKPLYDVLSDDQKRTADELIADHLRDMRMRGM
ncbi:MAG: Spy/CpxP family protein refolding chaperone [Acetobacteraceae bacterium]|nr:Spy/CpxP family protein refolding chaperone [Acetobacteraceae bacterium]